MVWEGPDYGPPDPASQPPYGGQPPYSQSPYGPPELPPAGPPISGRGCRWIVILALLLLLLTTVIVIVWVRI